jgi:cyclohexanone monooxygenase
LTRVSVRRYVTLRSSSLTRRGDPVPTESDVDVVVVGAGYSGLYLLHRLRGLGLRTVVLEAGDGVGGTWYWNRYPGARCDVESIEYAYSFSPELDREWRWTERYAAQPDILAYLGFVADRLDLRRDIRLGTRVVAAVWDGPASRWEVSTDAGDTVRARFAVMATGNLSVPKAPDIPGLATFGGRTLHTSRWPREGVDLTGRRVAVVGTGSSGVQVIPPIAEQAAHLTVLQRTPPFCVPAHNHPIDEVTPEALARRRAAGRQNRMGAAFHPRPVNAIPILELPEAEREAELERRWAHGGLTLTQSFPDLLTDRRANGLLADFIHRKVREQVHDPAVAERLCPTDYPVGAKRLCVDTGYYRTYNRDNVTLVDLRRAPIRAVERGGVRTTDGLIELDDLVLATGFDAMTGALAAIDIRGRDGLPLHRKWAAGPVSYLGLAVAGFPNLLTVTGPGSPSVLSNMRLSIEQHVDWIADCLGHLSRRGVATIEADAGGARACAGRPDPAARGGVLVHGRQRAGQAPGVHALPGRGARLPGGLRAGGRGRLPGLPPRGREPVTGRRPLTGITVVDATSYLAGPFATLMLADLGADVIKVEPPRGDPLRRLGYRHPGSPPEAPSVGFAVVNRDKRSVAADLRTADDRRRVLDLLARADVFVENWRPGVADRLGLDDATLARVNPRLVHVAITGWGPDGPWAARPAFDGVVQAVTSHAHAGGAGREPRLLDTALADKVAGTMAAQAALAALLARERGDGAGRVEVSMLDSCAYFAAPDLMETRTVVTDRPADPPRLAYPSTLVRCADGHVVVSPGSGGQLAGTCAAVGHPEWVETLRAQPTGTALAAELNRLLGTVTPGMTTAELMAVLDARDIPATPALDFDAQLGHPQVRHNGTYPEYTDRHLGRLRRARHPAIGAAWAPPPESTGAPAVGEHTDTA